MGKIDHFTILTISDWLTENFPNESRSSVALGLAEECGELARAVLKQRQGIRGTYEEWQEEIRKELGDIFIKLVHVAITCGIDPISAIHDRWAEVKQRDWTTDKTGHGLSKE